MGGMSGFDVAGVAAEVVGGTRDVEVEVVPAMAGGEIEQDADLLSGGKRDRPGGLAIAEVAEFHGPG